jgi:hypothetical protein
METNPRPHATGSWLSVASIVRLGRCAYLMVGSVGWGLWGNWVVGGGGCWINLVLVLSVLLRLLVMLRMLARLGLLGLPGCSKLLDAVLLVLLRISVLLLLLMLVVRLEIHLPETPLEQVQIES